MGVPEIVIIAAVVMVLFGSTRIPKLARSIGEAKRELNAALDDERPSASS
jgi:sec-independent protein translocase protein TatA